MVTQDEQLREHSAALHTLETAVQVHDAEDRLLHQFLRASLQRIEDQLAVVVKRLDDHSDEGNLPVTSPGVLTNPTTEPGAPRSRWDAPSVAQSGMWALAVSAFVGPVTIAIVSGIAAALGFAPEIVAPHPEPIPMEATP